MLIDTIGKNVFVVHALSGYEDHEEWINRLFNKHNLVFEYFTDGDVSLITPDHLRKYFTPDIKSKYSLAGISCTLNHILLYKKIIDEKIKLALIFEDDACFLGAFVEKLNRMSEELHALEKGYIISLENTPLTFPSFWVTKKNKYLYKAEKGRMTAAYIIDYEGAKRAYEDLDHHKCDHIVDWWHNDLAKRGIIRIYWAHPPFVEQGSHNGRFSGVMSSYPRSYTRRISWILQKYYKMYIRRLFK